MTIQEKIDALYIDFIFRHKRPKELVIERDIISGDLNTRKALFTAACKEVLGNTDFTVFETLGGKFKYILGRV